MDLIDEVTVGCIVSWESSGTVKTGRVVVIVPEGTILNHTYAYIKLGFRDVPDMKDWYEVMFDGSTAPSDRVSYLVDVATDKDGKPRLYHPVVPFSSVERSKYGY